MLLGQSLWLDQGAAVFGCLLDRDKRLHDRGDSKGDARAADTLVLHIGRVTKLDPVNCAQVLEPTPALIITIDCQWEALVCLPLNPFVKVAQAAGKLIVEKISEEVDLESGLSLSLFVEHLDVRD